MNDFLGREIKVGDTIVYPGRRGSSLWMNRGEVMGFDADSRGRTRLRVRRSPLPRESKWDRKTGSYVPATPRIVLIEHAGQTTVVNGF